MRKVLLLTALIAMIATGALAEKLPSKTAPANISSGHGLGKSLTEGFEGSVPPAGWGSVITNPGFTWYQDNLTVYEGMYAARVDYDPALVPQNEVMSFDYLVETGDDLSFFTLGSVYWAANAPFTVTVDGTVVYDFSLDNNGSSWVWEEVHIDLEPYVGSTVAIAFRYAGIDGAQQSLDAIQVGEYTPPPPVFVDFCDMIDDVDGTTFTGTTCGGMNLITSLGCEVYSEAGLEYYYEIEMPAGSSFSATVTNTADGALWVVSDCIAEDGAFVCLGYADDTLSGDPETVMYNNDTGGAVVVYLVLDSWGADSCGDYVFEFDGTGGAVAIEGTSLGSLKAMYR